MELLAEMQQRGLELNAIPCSTAISAYEEAKQPDKALELLAATQQMSMEPDVVTGSAAISACEKASSLTRQWSSWRRCSGEAWG